MAAEAGPPPSWSCIENDLHGRWAYRHRCCLTPGHFRHRPLRRYRAGAREDAALPAAAAGLHAATGMGVAPTGLRRSTVEVSQGSCYFLSNLSNASSYLCNPACSPDRTACSPSFWRSCAITEWWAASARCWPCRHRQQRHLQRTVGAAARPVAARPGVQLVVVGAVRPVAAARSVT